MRNTVIVGAQWGDEGKGKVIDVLARRADYIVRYQGGNNAGHTVVTGNETFILHLVPSGVLHQKKICIIGNGVVVDPQALMDELAFLRNKGIDVSGRFMISEEAHVIFPYHRRLDELRELKKTNRIGTTKRGIGPCYADKINRIGIRVVDLMNDRVFKEKLRYNIEVKNEILSKIFNVGTFSFDEMYKEYTKHAEAIRPYVANTTVILNDAIKKKKKIIFEGAQGALLDIDHGTYPFVTSSSATAGGACTGAGIGPSKIDKVIGVVKAYTTRVGEGPFPTEFSKNLMGEIRVKGNEFGATTGRPRRCGWFDAIVVKHSIMVNGIDEVAVTKLDVLDDLEKIKICTSYKYQGKTITDFPTDMDIMMKCQPVYEEVPGWKEDTTRITSYVKLPKNAKNYLKLLRKMLEIKIILVSVGSERRQTFVLE
ncbi:MAG: adenylosuccinate synthase [Candidatus Omnitrophota bacterium]